MASASLVMPSPPSSSSCSTTSSSSSAITSSRCSFGHRSFLLNDSCSLTFPPTTNRCSLDERLNGKPTLLIINNGTLPKFLHAGRLEGSATKRNDTRLKIFSGTGNPALARPVILDYLASKTISSNDLVVVSPDVGGVARARAFAKKLSDAPLAIVDKRRQGHNIAEVMNLIGDVRGKVAVVVDDMIDTAGTISKGAELLHAEGAREVYACSTHAVFSPPAIERSSSGLFQEVIITNTIPVKDENYFPQLTVLSVANLLGETIWRVHDDCSVSSIFK